jgi:hypothetical protein
MTSRVFELRTKMIAATCFDQVTSGLRYNMGPARFQLRHAAININLNLVYTFGAGLIQWSMTVYQFRSHLPVTRIF